ncbi:TetR/AcrR family transcriptional regulator [Bacillus sp. JJ722]|uniref:TetR/AcrR family transcriptional regulator n=1 Tax=Bacillus sp. JJ722 TaxID=3122973 RepID=UPI002FFFD9B0
MTARKAVDNELTKETIMEAARILFQEQGYRKVSMRQIAKVLGYSHGSIYYHFKNKAELFYALVNQDFAMLDNLLMKVMDQAFESPYEQLQEVCLRFIHFSFTHKSHYEMMFLIQDDELEGVKNSADESYDGFAKAVWKLCPKHANVHSIFSLFISLQGFITHYLKANVPFDEIESFAKSHVAFITRGLC